MADLKWSDTSDAAGAGADACDASMTSGRLLFFN